MINYHILTIKHVGQTNTSPAKVKIISELFKCSVKIPFTNGPGAITPTLDSAVRWLLAKGYDIVGQAEGKGHTYIITSTFKSIK